MAQDDKPSHKIQPLKATALLDVCFLLLIFFLVTASFSPDEGILVMPMIGQTTSGDSPPVVGPEIHLQSAGSRRVQILIKGEVAPLSGFGELYRRLVRLNQSVYGPASPATIHAESEVSWQSVLDAVNQAKAARFEPRLARPL
ncbi:MAG: biopolymer transporter ExbD [Phycisphaeraceae bacterium]|nr:biopolymer transporter ExbD [Phycisphaeraceae bacterium]